MDQRRASEFTNLYLEENFCRIPGSCRSPCQCVCCLFLVFSSFSCSPIGAGESCSHEESLPGTLLQKHRLVAAQQERHFAISLDQYAILNGKNIVTVYANPDLGMEIQWNKLTRQKTDMGFIRTGRLRQKNVSGKMKRNAHRTRQKVNTEIYLETKECGRGCNGKLRWTKVSRWGEGLELLRGIRESQSEDKGNRGAKQNKSAGGGLKLLRGTKETGAQKRSRWRRPGTSPRNRQEKDWN